MNKRKTVVIKKYSAYNKPLKVLATFEERFDFILDKIKQKVDEHSKNVGKFYIVEGNKDYYYIFFFENGIKALEDKVFTKSQVDDFVFIDKLMEEEK